MGSLLRGLRAAGSGQEQGCEGGRCELGYESIVHEPDARCRHDTSLGPGDQECLNHGMKVKM